MNVISYDHNVSTLILQSYDCMAIYTLQGCSYIVYIVLCFHHEYAVIVKNHLKSMIYPIGRHIS